MLITAPYRPHIPVPDAPARVPCRCTPGVVCAACRAWDGPTRAQTRQRHRRLALRQACTQLRAQLVAYEAERAALHAAQPSPLTDAWRRRLSQHYQQGTRLRKALRTALARLAGEEG
jgi:hypothetical protein